MPRNLEANQKMRDDRRDAILSAAARLFATRGLAATRVSDIARAVGMSQGLLYHYFPSKEEIFTDIVRTALTKTSAAARDLERAPLPPRAKLETMIEQVLAGVEHSQDFVWYSSLITIAGVSDAVPDEARAIIRRERDVPYRVVERIVRAGQNEGLVRHAPAGEIAFAFWTLIKGLALQKIAMGNAYRSPSPATLAGLFFSNS